MSPSRQGLIASNALASSDASAESAKPNPKDPLALQVKIAPCHGRISTWIDSLDTPRYSFPHG